MTIKTVVFDAVGTVMFPTPSVAAVYCEALQHHCGISVSEQHVRHVLGKALSERSLQSRLQTSEEDEFRFWRNLVYSFCASHANSENCLCALHDHFAKPSAWQCFDDTDSCLTQLQQAGVTTAIASNFDQRLHPVLDGLIPRQLVPHRFVSSQVGWRKPARPFFDHVCQELNCPPDRILFIGDDQQNDVYGPRRAGLHAAWLSRGSTPSTALPTDVPTLAGLSDLPHLLLRMSESAE